MYTTLSVYGAYMCGQAALCRKSLVAKSTGDLALFDGGLLSNDSNALVVFALLLL